MRKIVYLLSVAITSSSVLYPKEKWMLPDENLRYNQVSFYTSHNAFSSWDEGFTLTYQQNKSIKDQLEKYGVRGFMLDLWPYKGKISLCHGDCSQWQTRFKTTWAPKLFSSYISLFRDWLKKNPKEIVTIFLENRINNNTLKKELLKDTEFAKMILTMKDWNPEEHNGDWPTLKWMQENNKRIVIFNEDKSQFDKSAPYRATNENDPFFFIYRWVVENQYATPEIKEACHQRRESTEKQKEYSNRTLTLINFFKGIKFVDKTNNAEQIKKLIEYCRTHDFNPYSDWTANYIALDFVDVGDAIDYINDLNRQAKEKIKS